ncbi:Transketolase [Strongyloides ratti]|uniref:transketolase n=1 Tax=Strongyloides ratti TaxID=34506 RepID=A0A090L3Z2_STRRB|nr:Transketolase [Strongyloides ratti]CEF64536.1 Transketolase [Strongyloides ratti]
MTANIGALKDVANRLRIASIEMTSVAKSGHPTSSTSAAEIVATLFFNEMKYEVSSPKAPYSDRFVLSKGHACPVLYAAWEEAGLLSHEQILSLRKIDSDIEGHPTPRLNFIDVATGSLGQGLSIAAGMAWVGKYKDKASYRVYALLGDGETAEGSIWEAASFASTYKLDNLVTIVDVNRLGQSQETQLGHDVETYAARFRAFGHNAIIVNGNDVEELLKAYAIARNTKDKPTAIIAKTFKGAGIEGVENLDNWHGKPVPIEKIEAIKAKLTSTQKGTLPIAAPIKDTPEFDLNLGNIKIATPSYKLGDKVATRAAYGTALVKLGDASPHIIGLDGDTKNSTFSDKLLAKYPERFVECFIAEQNLVGVGIGVGCRGRAIPFCSTFAAFFTRAADQLRMGAISFANLKCAGSHAGISIGEDGPSQMALEDLSLFRSVANSVVLYPTDAVAAERAAELAANIHGIVFIRTGRPALPVIYNNDEPFAIGKAKVVRKSDKDNIVLVGAGVTLYECIKAADQLATSGINACIIDIFSVKPIDQNTLITEAKRCGGKVITVEDHYQSGGIGEAVSSALADTENVRVRSIFVKDIPRSGSPDGLLDLFGISAPHIVKAVKNFN